MGVSGPSLLIESTDSMISGVIFIYIWVGFIYIMAPIYICSPDNICMYAGYIYVHQIYIYRPYLYIYCRIYCMCNICIGSRVRR